VYPDLCLDLRRHSCLRLNLNPCLDLDLNLNLPLYPAPNHASFQKLFEEPDPALFHRLYGVENRTLFACVNLAPCREKLPWE
jgi:hypothetical protein